MALYKLPGYKQEDTLTKYIDDRVQPKPEQMSSLGSVVAQLVGYLYRFHEAVPGKDYRVSRVLKSGSLGRGTAVQNQMDVKLVVFMQSFTTMTEFLKELENILYQLECFIKNNFNLKVLGRNRYQVACLLSLDGTEHSVEIWPAVDLIASAGGVAAVHMELLGEKGYFWDGPLDNYIVCFAETQKQFVKKHTKLSPQMKNLILLVKFWNKENGLATMSYCLELVCIQVYKENNESYRSSVEDLFKKVMEKLTKVNCLRISFSDHYKPSEYQKYWTSPYVMDPADPFLNTLPQGKEGLEKMAKNAGEALKGRSNFLWDVLNAPWTCVLF